MTTIDLYIISRYRAIFLNGDYAIRDERTGGFAKGGKDEHELRHLTKYQANKWALVFNIVEKGGCGMCGRYLSTVRGPAFAHPDYRWICKDCHSEM